MHHVHGVSQDEGVNLEVGGGVQNLRTEPSCRVQVAAGGDVHLIVRIHLGDESRFDGCPVFAELCQRLHVNRRSMLFHPSRRRRIATAKQRAGNVNSRQHGRQQTRE